MKFKELKIKGKVERMKKKEREDEKEKMENE